MKRIYFILFVITGCSNLNDNSYQKNDDQILITKDTILDNEIFPLEFLVKVNEDSITRKGNYVNNSAIGEHKFYKKDILNVIRNYIYIQKDKLEFLYGIDSTIAEDVSKSFTFLNSAKYFDKHSNFKKDKSSYCDIILAENYFYANDSVKANIIFYEPQIQIKSIELYLDVPEDSSLVRIIERNGNAFYYSHKIAISEPKSTVSGMALIHGFLSSHLPTDTIMASKVMFFEKEYQIINVQQQ